MKRALILVVMLVAAVGCATGMFGHVEDSFARAYGCDPAVLDLWTEQVREAGEYGSTPRVGWDACQTLATMGGPREASVQESRYGRSANWWYGRGGSQMLVSLDREDDGLWRVDYVGR